MLNRTQMVCIILNCLLVVFFASMLGYYYRLVPEDYYAVTGNHQYGPVKQAIMVCNQWGGRFFSYLFSFILLQFHEAGFSYAFYFLAGNLLMLYSFFSIISYISKRYSLEIDNSVKTALSCLAFTGLFYLTPGIRESWFWVAASPSYYWGIVMAASGTALLARQKLKWFLVLPASACMMYACSASEPFALMILLFLSITIVFIHRRSGFKTGFSFSFVLLAALAGFLFMLLAKGTSDRWLAMPELNIFVKTQRLGGAVIKYFLGWFPTLTIQALLFSPILFSIGYYLKEKEIIHMKGTFFSQFIIIGSVYLLIIILSFLPSSFVMGEAGPLRSWHHIGLYNILFFFMLFIYTGFFYGSRFNMRNSVLTLYLFLVTGFHLIFLINQLVIAKHYSAAQDKRMALLHELQSRNFKGLVVLEKLPGSGYLFSAELGTDKDYYLNSFLKKGLKLEYEICVRK